MSRVLEAINEFAEKHEDLAEFLEILAPYMPALESLAEDNLLTLGDTIQAAIRGDWDRVDEVLVDRMTHQERLVLMDVSYKIVRDLRVKDMKNLESLRRLAASMFGALFSAAIAMVK